MKKEIQRLRFEKQLLIEKDKELDRILIGKGKELDRKLLFLLMMREVDLKEEERNQFCR